MNLRNVLALSLAGLLVTASGLLAAGGGHGARSPVGAWSIFYEDDVDPDGNAYLYQQFNRSGTINGGNWNDSQANIVGDWRKIRGNRFISTLWIMIPDADGYIKVIDEFWMIDKDTMEGRQESWWIVGPNPLNPPVPPLGPIWTGTQHYRRLTAESKQVP